ncbi:acetate--CoA ligase family protein, partial [Candidatus Dependentiae bacterium]|nr:acetate--CoA ligase family protein [Candidatus Dependentiae bacterium]
AQYNIDFDAVEKIKEKCVDENRNPLTDEALDICRAAGMVPVRYRTIMKPDELKNCDVAYPAAIKLLSRDASHKTDVGGVRLNIGSARDGETAIHEMMGSFSDSAPSISVDGFLVQEMSRTGEEFFVGARRDPVFGPVVVAGYGGIFIELINDRAMRLAPVTDGEAMDMLKELKMFPLFQGVRGSAPLDAGALVSIICRVSSLICAAEYIDEIDLNPVIVHRDGKGLSLVDARIYLG